MTTISERRIYNEPFADGKRWDSFVHRPGDVIIATPAKCGTTWTQTIVSSLLFPDGAVPGPVLIVSPWLDGRIEPAEPMLARLEKQEHRRFIKTHTPADGVPFWKTASYIVVLRDGRDAFMSLVNHMAKIRPEVMERLNAETDSDGGRMLNWSGDVHKDFPLWLWAEDSAPAYLASWWPLHNEPNVLFVHYNDLKRDLSGEMRRIASFLEIAISEDQWRTVVERCTFESMKARPDEIGPFDFVFEGGAESFLYKGTNGRWRDVLTDDELASYEDRINEVLEPEAVEWFEKGSIATGLRL